MNFEDMVLGATYTVAGWNEETDYQNEGCRGIYQYRQGEFTQSNLNDEKSVRIDFWDTVGYFSPEDLELVEGESK